ncbi:MAG: TolC family protein [Leptothrix sp. (in: b-proteobacteria)]
MHTLFTSGRCRSAARFNVVALAGLLALAALTPAAFGAGLSFEAAAQLGAEQAPSLLAQQSALAGAQAAQPAAATLPDPRLTVGVDNLPVSGADRWSLSNDFMTMRRIGVMQEVPNQAKRSARAQGAEAKVQRERAMLAVVRLAAQRETELAWLGVFFAERRVALLTELEQENRLLQDTLNARIASGQAMPADHTMAQLEALGLADRRDEATRDIGKARATLRRWVGVRADEPLDGAPPALDVQPEPVRAGMHRHAELVIYGPMQAMAQAEVSEAEAETRGDWAWEAVYSKRGAQYGDMVSFQLSFDLPLWGERRQQPQIAAKQKEIARIDAERQDLLRRHQEEIEGQLAELQALDSQQVRLASSGQRLAAERVTLALTSYQSGRGDLAGVLAARKEAVETRLRLLDLDAQRTALRVRLNTLIAE